MNDDARLDEQSPDDPVLAQALRALPAPPATPRDRMWTAIESRRHEATRRTRRRTWRWAGTGAALAAVLVLGFAIGRWTESSPGAGPVATVEDRGADRRTDGYRQAARMLFDRAEVRLAGFQSRPAGATRTATTAWADGLLTQTRLLLDSPAADDPDARRLLRELELVLAEIAALPDTGSAAQAARIADGLYERATVPRLRLAGAL